MGNGNGHEPTSKELLTDIHDAIKEMHEMMSDYLSDIHATLEEIKVTMVEIRDSDDL